MTSFANGSPQNFEVTSPTSTATGKPKLQYIDCLRGYAVLMVMTTHTTDAYSQLPYPVHRLGDFGWFGVQLFFLASCLTLMMSSTYEREHAGRMHIGSFFVRRFLRIAPMYYAAGIAYCLIASMAGFNPVQALSAILFVNSWHPETMPSNGGWQLVPGGWSIGVEFTFYFVFPIFFTWVTTFSRAAILLLCSLLVAAVFNSLLLGPLSASFGGTTADNFLYFWFFNQAPVFAMGAIVFFAIQKLGETGKLKRLLEENSTLLITLGILALVVIAMAPFHFSHALMFQLALPQYLAASVAFAACIIVFSRAADSIYVNAAAANLGKVSFSAYLVHFGIVNGILRAHPRMSHIEATGWPAIGWFALGLIFVVCVTYMISLLSYSVIELPMMKLAKSLTRNPAAVVRAQSSGSAVQP